MSFLEKKDYSALMTPPIYELKYADDWLLVFLDESGHETFAGDHPYYAVGGCAIMGRDHRWVQGKWKELRKFINGDPEVPLHAAYLDYKPENLAELSKFFELPSFARLAVAATNKTDFAVDMHSMAAVMGMLKEHIARITSVLPCSAVALIFESSERGDPLVQRYFGELNLTENGTQLPTEHCFMPKSANEPALEIADFIVNAAGTQARFRHKDKEDFAKDYQAVFHQFPAPFSQFFHIQQVGGSAEEHEAWIKGVRRAEP